jgi:PAS domain S-box-containing protein
MAPPGKQPESLNVELLVDSIPALIHTARPDGYIDYFNKRWLQYFGVTLDEVAGWNWTAVIHADDVEGILTRWRACLVTGEVFEYETRVRGANGEYRWMFHHKVPLRDENGNIVKWYGSSMDIHERKTAEEALRSSKAYLAEAQRLSQTGSFGWKPDTGEIVWSDETYRIFEYDRSVNPTIDSVMQRVHPEDRADFQKVIESASAGATQFEHTYRLLLPDGSVKHVHALAHALQDASGNREFVGAATDVTSIKRAEEELRKSEAYLAEAQRLSRTGSWAWSPDTDVRYWSEECYRVLGFDPHDGVPRMEELIWRIHPDDQPAFRESTKRAKHNKFDEEVNYRIVHPGGAVRDIHSIGHPVFSPCGDLIEYTGTVIDITERKRAEEAMGRLSRDLQESKAKLEEAQRITHVGYWEWDILTGRVNWSDETYRIYGMQPQERPMDIAACQEKIHPEDWQRGMEAALGGRARFDAECRVIRPTGEVRIAHFQGDVKRDASGHPYHMFGTVQDITDRKRAEDKIREQEAELRQILNLTPQLVAVFGPNLERLYANRGVLDYLGVSLEEWRKRTDQGEFFHPDDRERVRDDFDRARSTGSAFEVEMRGRGGDGSYRWMLVRYNPLRDDKGQITRWYAASTDIDERKRAEEKLQLENAALREEIDQTSMFEEIVGTSPALQAVLSRISKVAPSDSTVLITGETGTGKELVARAIHRRSRRSGRAFVSVNCAAIPRDLILSELFGHEKGAFTGAMQRRLGRFEMADGGTIFLDEVGELSPDTQVALLRVLQEREFERVGGGQPIRVDVRLIAATNRDLQAGVADGTFRHDLFYRLNVFPIEVPPLRERKDDILMLVEYFAQRYATKGGKRIRSIDKKTLDLLRSYAWPGNIRELQNAIERSVILSAGDVFSVDELWLSKETAVPASRVEPRPTVRGEVEPRSEREIIEAALAETRGRVSGPSGAAVKLGIPSSTLDDRIKALKINKKQFRFR